MTFPSGSPDCCPSGEGCLTGFISGSNGPTGFSFIIDNNPFQTGGDGYNACCDILCSGYTPVDEAKDTYIAYVSIDDGVGGYIENISGASGLQQPYTPNASCCTTTTFMPPPVTPLRTAEGYICPCFTSTAPLGTTECITTPTPYICYCCQSGYFNSCNFPFLWDPHTCKFTGLLFNNDGYTVSELQASGEIFFDRCRDAWVVCTNWSGSDNQWPDGECFFAECGGCTGLGQCAKHEGFVNGSYGLYKPESGPGSAAICYDFSSECAYPYPYPPCGS